MHLYSMSCLATCRVGGHGQEQRQRARARARTGARAHGHGKPAPHLLSEILVPTIHQRQSSIVGPFHVRRTSQAMNLASLCVGGWRVWSRHITTTRQNLTTVPSTECGGSTDYSMTISNINLHASLQAGARRATSHDPARFTPRNASTPPPDKRRSICVWHEKLHVCDRDSVTSCCHQPIGDKWRITALSKFMPCRNMWRLLERGDVTFKEPFFPRCTPLLQRGKREKKKRKVENGMFGLLRCRENLSLPLYAFLLQRS